MDPVWKVDPVLPAQLGAKPTHRTGPARDPCVDRLLGPICKGGDEEVVLVS